jgi:hypothetical protein
VAEPEVRAHRFGLALALLVAALALGLRRVAQVGVVQADAGEVGRLGLRRRLAAGVQRRSAPRACSAPLRARA